MPQARGRFYSSETTPERRVSSRAGPFVPKSKNKQRKLLAESIAEIEKMDGVRVYWDRQKGEYRAQRSKKIQKEESKPLKKLSRPPLSERKREFLRMWLHTWETGAERQLSHDRDTLYGIAEQLSLWTKWFPGCKMVNIISTRHIQDERSRKHRVVPQTIIVLFGKTSLKLHVRLDPGRLIELTTEKPTRPGDEEDLEKVELGWYFRDSVDPSNATAEGGPAVGARVSFHISARNYANTIRNYDELWGQGVKHAAKQFMDGLEQRASELQSQNPATETGMVPDPASREDEQPNLIRRLPTRPRPRPPRVEV